MPIDVDGKTVDLGHLGGGDGGYGPERDGRDVAAVERLPEGLGGENMAR